MAMTHIQGNPVHTNGELPQVGATLPDLQLASSDFTDFSLSDFAGKRVVLNIFPSIDTPVCAMSVRRFNQEASTLDNTVVVCASMDLPVAMARFCGAEGIENVQVGSSFRSDFGEQLGVVLTESPRRGLLARAVVVADEDLKVTHVELVEEMSTEPDYEAALAALR